MQLNNLQLFLGSIDLLTAIVAVCVCVIMTILKKVLKEKLKTSISVYLPTVLAVVIHFTITTITDGIYCSLSINTIYDGLISGSVSTVISVAITRFINGKPLTSPKIMIIEGILKEIINKEHIQSVTQEILLVVEEDDDEFTKTTKVSEIIFNYTNLEMGEEQLQTLSVFIVNSISQIKK